MSENKVTEEQVKENMKDVLCKTVEEFGKKVTYVTVKMLNGFTLRESTTCVDPANYSEEIGKQICLNKIEDKIWFLLGFKLQDKIANEPKDFVDRLSIEYHILSERIKKLSAALDKPGFKEQVGERQFALMTSQLEYMRGYQAILQRRLSDFH